VHHFACSRCAFLLLWLLSFYLLFHRSSIRHLKVDVLASHWPWPQKEPTPVALPGPLPCASLSGDMISTLVTDVNIPPAVWPRFLSASTATEAATSGTGTAGGGRDGEVLAQPKGTNRRTAEAPAALLRLGAWDTRSSSSGGGGGAKEVAKGDETSSGGAIAALPPAVSAPFSVVAVAHADGCVSVNALTRDAWPDDDLFQVRLHSQWTKMQMSRRCHQLNKLWYLPLHCLIFNA